MILSEIIIDSFVLLAAIMLLVTVVSYALYKIRLRRKSKSRLRNTFVKAVETPNQFVNFQLADNNYNMNYYSYQNTSNSNGAEIEINNTPPQYIPKQESGNVKLKRKNYHPHKSTNSISKISYK